MQPIEPRGPGNPSWSKGVSANPRGRENAAQRRARRDAIIAAWAEPYGGIEVLRPAELMLLNQAAELSMVRPRRSQDQVRHANTISKILTQVGFVSKHPREPLVEEEPPPDRSATDWLNERLAELQEAKSEP